MDWSKVQDVMIICVPVFAMIALGAVLRKRGVLNDDHRDFANWLTYNFSLPSLIFLGVARQRFSALFELPLVVAPLVGVVLVTILFVVLARLLKLRGSLAAAFVFGTFWSNVSYMGFPLATNAYGSEGLGFASVYNAFIMPTFVVLGFLLIGAYGGGDEGGIGDRIRRAFVNPIVGAVVFGMLVSLLGEAFWGDDGTLALPAAVLTLLSILGGCLNLVGSMGLPLALLSVGGSMHFSEIRRRAGLLSLVLTGKLVLFPLFTWLTLRLLFPGANPMAATVAVMLSATPNAVASYVLSREIGVEEGFVSSMLVLSTALSVITLPVWLYVVLG